MIGNIVKNGKFMDQGIKIPGFYNFQTLLKQDKKRGTEKCVQYASICVTRNDIYMGTYT